MLSLLQTENRPAEPLPLEPPSRRRSPGAAFALSLIFPGLGHAYLRRWKIAAWTAGGFLFCLLCSQSETPAFLGMFLIGVPALYIFGAADAFCAAREWNAGVAGRLIGTNPRVATLLNALTKGFGYFYLGQRGKGIAVIVVMVVLSSFARTPWLSVAAIVLQLLIAADGYRVARQQLLKTNPELAATGAAEGTQPELADAALVAEDPIAAANHGSLPPAVVTAVLCLVGAAALVAIFTVNLTNGRINHAPGTVEIDGGGLHYRNAKLGIALTAPEDWDTQPTANGLLRIQQGTCAFSIVDNTLYFGGAGFAAGIRNGMLKSYPTATFGPAETWHGPARVTDGMTITMVPTEKVIHENWFGLRHGAHLLSIFEAYPADNATCVPQFQQIEKSLVLR